jgi:hypothetical protein
MNLCQRILRKREIFCLIFWFVASCVYRCCFPQFLFGFDFVIDFDLLMSYGKSRSAMHHVHIDFCGVKLERRKDQEETTTIILVRGHTKNETQILDL